MSEADTARALRLIQDELGDVPEAGREAVADRVLGALYGHFMFLPRPTAAEEAATRIDLATLDIPGFNDFIPPTKGRT